MLKRYLPIILLVAGLFATAPAAALAATNPTVKLYPATPVGNNTATLVAEVATNGATTSYHFNYGPTKALGSTTATGKLSGSTKPAEVKSGISELQPGTTYYFDLAATNSAGTTTSSIGTFKTTGAAPPAATTGGTSDLTSSAATVTGVVTPNGASTTYFFEYGLSNTYGLQTAPATVPAGGTPVSVAANINGLQSGATFHYQLVVIHSGASAVGGGDQTFETFPNPAPTPRLRVGTSPRHESGGPFLFTTSGSISYTAPTPSALACTGQVVVRFVYGRTQLTIQRVQLNGNCSFSLTTRLRHKPSRARGSQRISVQVRYEGGNYLGRSRASSSLISVG